MYRKFTIALGAIAILAAAALAPTAALAKKGKKWHGHRFHAGIVFNPVVLDRSDCYVVKKVSYRHGYKRVRYIEVCD
jgi:hypothetical protein